jgi:putative ABC transport system permease protein
MFTRYLKRSFQGQRTELFLAVGAVLLASALIAAMVAVPAGMGRKLQSEARAYGPNFLIRPDDVEVGPHRTMDQAVLSTLQELAQGMEVGLDYAPYLYGLVQVVAQGGSSRRAVLAGTLLERTLALKPWWTLSGNLPRGPDEAILGAEAAAKLGLAVGDTLTIEANGQRFSLNIVGVVTTGDVEENYILIELGAAQRILGRPKEISVIALRVHAAGRSVPLEVIASEFDRRLPEGRVEVLRSLAQAEASLLRKVQLLLALIAAVSVGAAILCVMSALTASVLKREREIGLMKALGAENLQIGAFFLVEALMIGLVGGTGGFLVGDGLTQLIGLLVVKAALPYGLSSLPAALAVGLVTVLVAVWAPIHYIVRLEPIRALEVS